jgi:hypothetical protein
MRPPQATLRFGSESGLISTVSPLPGKLSPRQKLPDLYLLDRGRKPKKLTKKVGGVSLDSDQLAWTSPQPRLPSPEDVCYYSAVPCEVAQRIEQVIASDRRTIFTFCAIYPAIFTCAVIVSLYFHYFPLKKDDPLLTLAGVPVSLIAVPLVLQHLRRAESLRILRIYRSDCDQHSPADPACDKIAEAIGAMIQERAGIK